MAITCPNCGYTFDPSPFPPYAKRLHWSFPNTTQPLCRVDKRGLYTLSLFEDKVSCKNCLKELAYRRSKGLPV